MRTNVLRIEAGCIRDAGSTLRQNGVRGKILYVSGPVVHDLYGGQVCAQLREVGQTEHEVVLTNTLVRALEIAGRVVNTDAGCIVAMGGGKVQDVCKMAAYMTKKPLLAIPTTAANDGLASPIAVLKREDGRPKSLGCAIPAMVLIDLDVIRAGPPELIRAGIGDTISNYMALRDWRLACARGKDRMDEYAYILSKNAVDSLAMSQFSGMSLDFLNILVNSLVVSGIAMDLAGSSRPVSGSEHLFSHALDYYAPEKNLHGLQVALGTVAVLKLIGEDYRTVIDYLDRFGVDIHPGHMGIDEDVFVQCMQRAPEMRPERYTYLNETPLESGALRELYRELSEELQ